MFQQFLADTEHIVWPLAATVIFFLTFVLVVAYVIAGAGGGKNFDHVASLPLEEDEAPRAMNRGTN